MFKKYFFMHKYKLQTGLQLLTANTGTDQSTLDNDGVSSDAEDKRAKITTEVYIFLFNLFIFLEVLSIFTIYGIFNHYDYSF